MHTATHSTQTHPVRRLHLRDSLRVNPLATGFTLALIIVVGLIHFIDAPSDFADATYKGILFLLNGAGALLAAYGIYRGEKVWGWLLGLIVAGGAFVGYIISRTIGLPGIGVESDWFEPLGVLAMITEAAYLVTSIAALTGRLSGSPEHKQRHTSSSR